MDCDRNRDDSSVTTNWAIVKLDELVARWHSHPDFPAENHLIGLWIRRTDNVNKGWVAANGGTRLRQQGITAQRLSDPDGPVIRKHLIESISSIA